jgi:3-hydroxyisobutyrate dehydrogenase
METVGFIGLGAMGGPVAGHIQRAGYPMVVYDVRDEATRSFCQGGATVVDSAAALSRKSDVIITALPMPEDVEQVACGRDGIIEGIRPDSVYLDISTSPPSLIRRLEPLFRAKGASVLDAPMASGQPGAVRGIHEVMVGGQQEIFERVKPILSAFGDQVLYAGPLGSGSICKLVHQMIGSSISQAIAEGLSLGVKAGVETTALWECVRRGMMGRMHVLHYQVPQTVFRGKFETETFPLRLLRKDVRLATEPRQGVKRSTAGGEYHGTDSRRSRQPWLGGQGCLHGYFSAPGRGGTNTDTRRRSGPGAGSEIHFHPSRRRVIFVKRRSHG